MKRAITSAVILALAAGRALAANPVVKDLFDRDVTQRGITLTDWEGYMANPAIEIRVVPPADAAFPLTAAVTAPEPRLYFDLPSEGSAQGPRKQLKFAGNEPVSLAVAIFPARDKKKSESALNFQFTDARSRRWQLALPVHIAVSDHAAGATGSRPAATTAPGKPEVFPITVDFSQDKTGFYKDEARRKLFEQAVQDWAFYFAPVPLKEVPAGAEKTWIFEPTGFTQSNLMTNARPFTGFLLYAYGVDGPEIRSGGEPSRDGALQQSDGKKLTIHRSGGMEIEIKGNYNKLGWDFSIRDDQWWKATNLAAVQNDFYSIVHHECGHAFIFNPNNPKFVRSGVLRDDALRAYLGTDPVLDKTDHLDGILDPASLRGGFGNEYHGKVPYGRWLITKLDLLVAQAVGWKLREVDSLLPLAIVTNALAPAALGKVYSASLRAQGGMPIYDWAISEGKLPPGLTLDRFTGAITGMPSQAGEFALTISARDYTKNGAAVTRGFTLKVK